MPRRCHSEKLIITSLVGALYQTSWSTFTVVWQVTIGRAPEGKLSIDLQGQTASFGEGKPFRKEGFIGLK